MRLRRLASGLPHPTFVVGILARSVAVWFGVRGFLLLAGHTVSTASSASAIVVVVAGLTVLDGRRLGESLLLANLGIPEWRLAVVAAIPPTLFELGISLLA